MVKSKGYVYNSLILSLEVRAKDDKHQHIKLS
jgi:hypothetical protein